MKTRLSVNLEPRCRGKAHCSASGHSARNGRFTRKQSNLCRPIACHCPSGHTSRTLSFYENHAREFYASTANLKADNLYVPFLKELSPGSRILDAGCGSGRDAKAFKAKGFAVEAVDASPELARLASRLIGQTCQIASFQQIDFRSEFDGIWACASIIHVPGTEIKEVLRRLARALKPNGILYVSLKEGHGEKVLTDGRLFNYYTSAEFRQLLTADGLFEIVDIWKSKALDSSGQTWLNFLARKSK
jgi:SAM-dependent methyltransferase